MDPKHYVAVVALRGYPESTDELASRIRSCLETHPTLSLRVDEVAAGEAPTHHSEAISIRDALNARVLRAARALREARKRSGDGAKAWVEGLVSGERKPLDIAGRLAEAKALNEELDRALDALDDYDRRTA
jgi:hypothetical protein